MTGPQHYKEAERLLEAVHDKIAGTGSDLRTHEQRERLLAEAQVHATLAQAAATAWPAVLYYCGDEQTDARAWATVTAG